MNREDIIRMALEAGIEAEADTLCRYEGFVEPLERFATLVASAERDACAKVCEEQWEIDGTRTAQEFATTIRARGQA